MSLTTDPARFDVPEPRDLRAMRLIARLTVREAAGRVGVDKNTIHRWESGETSPKLREVRTLLDVYQAELHGQQQLKI